MGTGELETEAGRGTLTIVGGSGDERLAGAGLAWAVMIWCLYLFPPTLNSCSLERRAQA